MLLLLPIELVTWLIRRFLRWIDRDESKGFVNIPDHSITAISRIVRGLLYIAAAMASVRLAGFDASTALGAGGIVGFAVGFALKDVILSVVGGIYALFSSSIQDGMYIEVGDAQCFVERLGLVKSELYNPATRLTTLLNNSLFWTDPTIITSKQDMTHIIEIVANPDNVSGAFPGPQNSLRSIASEPTSW